MIRLDFCNDFALFIRPLANCYFPRDNVALAYCAAVLVGAAAAAPTVSPLSRLYCSHTWGSLDVRLQIALVIHTLDDEPTVSHETPSFLYRTNLY